MNRHFQSLSKSVKFLGAMGGGILVSLLVIPQQAGAQLRSTPGVNPCPSVFYEQPHNYRVLVPQGCPANAYTQQQINLGRLPAANYGTYSANPTPEQVRRGVGGEYPSTTGVYRQPVVSPRNQVRTIPAPETRQNAIAYVSPTNGQVSVRLKNDTNVGINYEAIGYTERRVLQPGQEVVLRNLPVPVSITTVRLDDGFVQVLPTSTESGVIGFTLDEQRNVDDNQGVIRIQQDGQVFLN
ncbi:MAG: hypothetical protein SAK29_36975 [Scytonema sp. PMC 1069.18]|nr:hypothetical protein [Scytonema sp. PMC 1069.18]MEC4880375.1 hypothetical protein [Scytonema sp. PMC 1070.18]